MVEHRVLDRADARALAAGMGVPADHDEIGAGRVASEHAGGMAVSNVITNPHVRKVTSEAASASYCPATIRASPPPRPAILFGNIFGVSGSQLLILVAIGLVVAVMATAWRRAAPGATPCLIGAAYNCAGCAVRLAQIRHFWASCMTI